MLSTGSLGNAAARHSHDELGHIRSDSEWPVMICLLGGFQLLKFGRLVPLRYPGKTQTLLSSLALGDNYGAPREELLLEIWPDTQPGFACKSLNSLVHSLHKLLGDALDGATPVLYTDGYYHLNTGAGIGVDTALFEAYSREGFGREHAIQWDAAVSFFERAINLYRGDLWTSRNTRTLILCESLRATYLTVLARLGDHYYQAGNYSRCLDYALRILLADPCREDACRLAMRCYLRQGERAQALHQYRLCENILGSEFDTSPEPMTEALYQQIRLNPSAVV
jgi:DNA-binding SARP family transcriptional activator